MGMSYAFVFFWSIVALAYAIPAPVYLPPSNFQGSSHEIGTLGDVVYYNQLDWGVPAGGTVPTSYRIFRNGIFVEEVPPETFTWQDPNTPQGADSTVTYSIVSLSNGNQSAILTVTVTRGQG